MERAAEREMSINQVLKARANGRIGAKVDDVDILAITEVRCKFALGRKAAAGFEVLVSTCPASGPATGPVEDHPSRA